MSMTKFSITGTFLISCALPAAVGCGGSDDDNSRRYVSGVEETKDVSMLTPDEKMKLCSTVDAHVSTYLDFDAIAYVSCIPGAIWTTNTAEACRTSLANCMSLFPKPIKIDVNASANQQVCYDNLAQCNATVAQLEGCVDVNLDRALDIVDVWTCDRVGDMQLRQMAEPKASTALVCTNVNAACNQFANVNGPD